MKRNNFDKDRNWHLMSARDKVLGRLATEVARLLIGKHKRNYVPNQDIGDFVVVTEAEHVKVTGNKETQKVYGRYSGFPGGRKTTTFATLREKHPEKIIEMAVKGMLPDNKLKSGRMNRLKVFRGVEHPYANKLQVPSAK